MSVASTGVSEIALALLTTMSSPPKCAAAVSIAVFTAASSRTSTQSGSARPPAAAISAAAVWMVPGSFGCGVSLFAAIAAAVDRFGGIDILINNASAISLTGTLETTMKRFDLMHQINTRGTFVVSKWAIPYLEKAANPHILMLSPPLDMQEKWFARHTAYTMAKFGMSLVVLGLAGELRAKGIAVNALWPRTAIDTEAIRLIAGQDARKKTRRPEIVADAAYWIVTQPSRKVTGRFFLDDEVLRSAGITDFSRYLHEGVTERDLMGDFFL